LLTLMKDKYDLIGKLRSLKRYLLLDQVFFCYYYIYVLWHKLYRVY